MGGRRNAHSGLRRLLLLCGEVKELAPARHGHLAIIKHMPDQPFAIDGQLFARMERRFELALSLWGATDGIHLVTLATFGLNAAGVPNIDQLTLMPVDEHWMPVRDMAEVRLLQTLVGERRRFIKVFSVPSPSGATPPTVALVDAGDQPVLLHVVVESPGHPSGDQPVPRQLSADRWIWRAEADLMPPLPAAIYEGVGTTSCRPRGVRTTSASEC